MHSGTSWSAVCIIYLPCAGIQQGRPGPPSRGDVELRAELAPVIHAKERVLVPMPLEVENPNGPAEPLLNRSRLLHRVEKFDIVKIAERQNGSQIGTAETILVCKGYIVGRQSTRSLHV